MEALRLEKERLQIALRVQARESEVLATSLSTLEDAAKAEPPPAPSEQPKRVAEPVAEPVAEQQKPSPPPPPVSSAPVLLEQRPDTGSSSTTPSQSEPGPSSAAPAYAGPASGVVIWTGVLSNGSVLTIQGKQASTGSVTGRLPATPVRVTAYPAELSSAGLTVFTADQRHAGAGLKEPPSARNSWTQTFYRYAPDRTRTVEVVQWPSPDNNWNFVAVRASGQTLTTVVISWERLK